MVDENEARLGDRPVEFADRAEPEAMRGEAHPRHCVGIADPDHEPPLGPQDAGHVAQRGTKIVDEVDGVEGGDAVEARVGERYLGQRSGLEAQATLPQLVGEGSPRGDRAGRPRSDRGALRAGAGAAPTTRRIWQVLVLAREGGGEYGYPPSDETLTRLFSPVAEDNNPNDGGLGMSPEAFIAEQPWEFWDETPTNRGATPATGTTDGPAA
jgi:hypothetical protein